MPIRANLIDRYVVRAVSTATGPRVALTRVSDGGGHCLEYSAMPPGLYESVRGALPQSCIDTRGYMALTNFDALLEDTTPCRS